MALEKNLWLNYLNVNRNCSSCKGCGRLAVPCGPWPFWWSSEKYPRPPISCALNRNAATTRECGATKRPSFRTRSHPFMHRSRRPVASAGAVSTGPWAPHFLSSVECEGAETVPGCWAPLSHGLRIAFGPAGSLRSKFSASISTARAKHRSSIASLVKKPCLTALPFPNGAPDPAPPCMRQRVLPRNAGARHVPPLRICAPQRGLACIGPVLRAWLMR